MSVPKEFRERLATCGSQLELLDIVDDLIEHRIDAFEDRLAKKAEGEKSKK